MTSTRPVLNLQSPIAVVKDNKAYVIPPWNSFFQQLVQAAPEVDNVTIGNSPFSFTANSNGTAIVTGGTISALLLIRGTVSINLTGQRIIPISIGDTIRVTYSVKPTLQFLGN